MTSEKPIGPWFTEILTVGDGSRRGDRVEHVQDIFRLLRRAEEYLIEADRQLRQAISPQEEIERDAWYADMDSHDEWTGLSAEAHADCVLDILAFFDEHASFISQLNGKFYLVGNEWRKLDAGTSVTKLRADVLKMQARIRAHSPEH